MIADLNKLREREAKLEASIAEEKREMDLRSANVARMAEELSNLKKIIGPMALLNLAQV